LSLYAQALALLLAYLDLFFQHNASLNANIVFRLQVFQGWRLMSCLLLKVVVGDFDIAQLESERAVGVAQRGDFLLQRI
jgi:hypothetical protein